MNRREFFARLRDGTLLTAGAAVGLEIPEIEQTFESHPPPALATETRCNSAYSETGITDEVFGKLIQKSIETNTLYDNTPRAHGLELEGLCKRYPVAVFMITETCLYVKGATHWTVCTDYTSDEYIFDYQDTMKSGPISGAWVYSREITSEKWP